MAPVLGRIIPSDPVVLGSQEMRLWLFVQTVALREVDPGKAHLVMEFRQHLIASLVRFREWQVADAPARRTCREPAPKMRVVMIFKWWRIRSVILLT